MLQHGKKVGTDFKFLRQVAETLRCIYRDTKTSIQLITKIIDRLKRTTFGCMISNDQHYSALQELVTLYPKWISLKQFNDGERLRANPSVSVQEILSDLSERLHQQNGNEEK